MIKPGISNSVPPPDLKIVPIHTIFPHEEHDPQRSDPLLNTLQQATYFTNPPIVAPMSDDNYVLLDGSNRYHCFCKLEYEHLLVQIAPYESDFVQLGVWQHVISDWHPDLFLKQLYELDMLDIQQGDNTQALAQILLRDGRVLSINVPTKTIEEQNHALRQLVHVYREEARLGRTASTDPTHIWHLHPDAIALVFFPQYQPDDIISAARHRAFLPPGISRHIVNGRALKLNYPMADIRDMSTSIEHKNDALHTWMQQKIKNREMRYYAESTYVFDE